MHELRRKVDLIRALRTSCYRKSAKVAFLVEREIGVSIFLTNIGAYIEQQFIFWFFKVCRITWSDWSQKLLSHFLVLCTCVIR